MKATISILVLQEAIKKTRCNGLVNSAVIEFKDNQIQMKGSGIETMTGAKGEVKSAGKVDGSMSFKVCYPTPVQEAGKMAVSNLADLLTNTEIFEKDDLVTAYIQGNQLILSRELPVLTLTYDLADIKFVPSAWKEQQEVLFGNPIVLKNLKGVSKEFPLTAEVVMDAGQLKAFSGMANKIAVKKVPLQVKDGKFVSVLKGASSSTLSEIKTDKTTGEAIATYNSDILDIFNVGFGLATLKFGTNSMILLHYELNQQSADYILVPAKNEQTAPIQVPVTPVVTTPVTTPVVATSTVNAATI